MRTAALRPRRALIIQHDKGLQELLRRQLDTAGFDVFTASNGASALRQTRALRFDLLVVELRMHGVDAASVCRAVRAQEANADTPILVVAADLSETDVVTALDSGADETLARPFSGREFLARVNALLRRHDRSGQSDAAALTVAAGGQVQLDRHRRLAWVRGHPVELTRQEFEVLERLAARPGIVFSRAALLEHLWSEHHEVTERTIDTVISRLRKKIERQPHRPELLLTAWGVGYKFAATVL